ncbi:hypothetical protein [uncultured Methanobrevibacter sp.]|uniref:hypothetical protein n=1 Tax=uncultured Methanobrevibacter sp. TaxID=253161 RepID=UPI0025E5B113|nr:hypothetical protein [uncultured Methanobrevibacter sp.]
MYLIKLIRQIKIWKKINKILKEPDVKLNIEEAGFRVDWIGRMYTVIHLPEEVVSSHQTIQQAYVLNALRQFDSLFLRLGFADAVSPEFKQIDNENYLLIICPDYDTFAWYKVLGFIAFCTGIIYAIIKILQWCNVF